MDENTAKIAVHKRECFRWFPVSSHVIGRRRSCSTLSVSRSRLIVNIRIARLFRRTRTRTCSPPVHSFAFYPYHLYRAKRGSMFGQNDTTIENKQLLDVYGKMENVNGSQIIYLDHNDGGNGFCILKIIIGPSVDTIIARNASYVKHG